jgi:hypothetical protein
MQAVETAVDRINAAGGVLDERVRLVVADEGSSTATATASIQTLLDTDVDAIIGPASSLTAMSTLDDIVSAGKVACSPTASSLALDEFPDEGCSSGRCRAIPCRPERSLGRRPDRRATHRHRLRRRRLRTGVRRRRGGISGERGRSSVVDRIGFASDDDDVRPRHDAWPTPTPRWRAARREGRHEVPGGARRRRHQRPGDDRRQRRTAESDHTAANPGSQIRCATEDRRPGAPGLVGRSGLTVRPAGAVRRERLRLRQPDRPRRRARGLRCPRDIAGRSPRSA